MRWTRDCYFTYFYPYFWSKLTCLFAPVMNNFRNNFSAQTNCFRVNTQNVWKLFCAQRYCFCSQKRKSVHEWMQKESALLYISRPGTTFVGIKACHVAVWSISFEFNFVTDTSFQHVTYKVSEYPRKGHCHF